MLENVEFHEPSERKIELIKMVVGIMIYLSSHPDLSPSHSKIRESMKSTLKDVSRSCRRWKTGRNLLLRGQEAQLVINSFASINKAILDEDFDTTELRLALSGSGFSLSEYCSIGYDICYEIAKEMPDHFHVQQAFLIFSRTSESLSKTNTGMP